MSFIFPSVEWASAYKDALNGSAAYKQAGKDWTHGVVAMVVKADPALDRIALTVTIRSKQVDPIHPNNRLTLCVLIDELLKS